MRTAGPDVGGHGPPAADVDAHGAAEREVPMKIAMVNGSRTLGKRPAALSVIPALQPSIRVRTIRRTRTLALRHRQVSRTTTGIS